MFKIGDRFFYGFALVNCGDFWTFGNVLLPIILPKYEKHKSLPLPSGERWQFASQSLRRVLFPLVGVVISNPVALESRWQGVPYHLSYKTVLATFTAHGS